MRVNLAGQRRFRHRPGNVVHQTAFLEQKHRRDGHDLVLSASSGFSSTLTRKIFRRPSYSAAISSKTGSLVLQGPHQEAQKSTRTGNCSSMICYLNSVSPIAGTLAMISPRNLLLRISLYPCPAFYNDLIWGKQFSSESHLRRSQKSTGKNNYYPNYSTNKNFVAFPGIMLFNYVLFSLQISF